jgi:hypothetical protein
METQEFKNLFSPKGVDRSRELIARMSKRKAAATLNREGWRVRGGRAIQSYSISNLLARVNKGHHITGSEVLTVKVKKKKAKRAPKGILEKIAEGFKNDKDFENYAAVNSVAAYVYRLKELTPSARDHVLDKLLK